MDSTGGLWSTGALAGKFAGTFFSTASQHGGQETTALTAVTYFAHHGINYVPFGFANSHLFDNSEVVGGSPYGAGTVGKFFLFHRCFIVGNFYYCSTKKKKRGGNQRMIAYDKGCSD